MHLAVFFRPSRRACVSVNVSCAAHRDNLESMKCSTVAEVLPYGRSPKKLLPYGRSPKRRLPHGRPPARPSEQGRPHSENVIWKPPGRPPESSYTRYSLPSLEVPIPIGLAIFPQDRCRRRGTNCSIVTLPTRCRGPTPRHGNIVKGNYVGRGSTTEADLMDFLLEVSEPVAGGSCAHPAKLTSPKVGLPYSAGLSSSTNPMEPPISDSCRAWRALAFRLRQASADNRHPSGKRCSEYRRAVPR